MPRIGSARVAALFLLGALIACEVVTPTNPFDPAAPPEVQAPGSIGGAIVLVDGFGPEVRARQLGAVRVGLQDENGLRLAREGLPIAVPLIEVDGGDTVGGSGRFVIEDLVPGNYSVVVEGVPAVYDGTAPATVKILPGDAADVGELVFTFLPGEQEADGPGSISGTVTAEGGSTTPRRVSIFQKSGGSVEARRTAFTDDDGLFSVTGLGLGTYAVVVEAEGFTPAYRMDLEVGTGGTAKLAQTFDGEDAIVVHPISAVLLPVVNDPTVVADQGVTYVRGDVLPLTVLRDVPQPDVGITRMRLATNAAFVDDADAPLAFIAYDLNHTVTLLDVEGPQLVHAQFEARSPGGFAFTSPIFTLAIVRDVSPPVIVEASLLGLVRDGAGGPFLSPSRLLSVRVDGLDDFSALHGIGVAVDAAPTAVDELTASAGLQRLERAITADDDGARSVFIILEDRARNRSAPLEIPVVVDTVVPAISLALVDGGNVLRSRVAQLVVTSGEAGDDVDVSVGLQGDIDESEAGPAGQFTVIVPDNLASGTVGFEAVAVDVVGNRSIIASLTVNLELQGSVSGVLSSDGVPSVQSDVVGATVTLLNAAGATVDTVVINPAAIGPDGDAVFTFPAVPEGDDYVVRAGLAGHDDVSVLRLDVVNLTDTDTGAIELPLLRGDVQGSAKRGDVVGNATAHGGITVALRLVSATRRSTATTITDAAGAFSLRVPRTLAGESYAIDAVADEYGGASTTTTLAGASSDVGTLLLQRARGDFTVCRPLNDGGDAGCSPIGFTNSDTIDLRLLDATDVASLIVSLNGGPPATLGLGGSGPQNRTNVDIGGVADGVLAIAVQAEKSDGTRGEVLAAEIVVDNVAPEAVSLLRNAAAGARNPRFTAANFVDVVVEADAGAGALPTSAQAPLADARVVVADAAPAVAPVAGFVACPGVEACRVELVDDEERLFRVFAFACDLAGNCAEPEETFVIRDVTRPSAANGASFDVVAAGSVVDGGVVVLPSPFYSGAIGLGHAQTLAGADVVDEDDVPVPEVFGFRFSLSSSTLSRATIQTFSDPPVVDAVRDGADIVVPALVQSSAQQSVFAQLVDAAGNLSDAFEVEVIVDIVGPDAVVVVNGGLPSQGSSVPFTLAVPAGGEDPVSLEIFVDNAPVQVFAVPLVGELLVLPAGEGLHRFVVAAVDRVGNVSRSEGSIVVDTSAPRLDGARCISATCVDDGLPASVIFTRDAGATIALALSPFDALTSVTSVEITFDPALAAPNTVQTRLVNAASAIVVPASTSSSMSIVPIDAVGNRGAALVRAVRHDVAGPTVASVVINTGDAKTNRTQVAVAIAVPDGDATGLRLSSSSSPASFSGPVIDFRADDFFVLGGVDGVKQVCAEVSDAAGNASIACGSIELDRSAPIGTVTVASALTRALEVTASLTMPAETVKVAASTSASSCDPATTSYTPALPPGQTLQVPTDGGDGVRTVFACFLDGAGNFSLATTTLTVDRTPPTVAVTLNGGATFALNTTPTALVSASSDATALVSTVDAALDCATATYGAFTTAPVVALPSAEGLHTVRVCVRDGAGNVSAAPAISTIVLDTTRPAGSVVVDGGALFTRQLAVSLALTASSDAVQFAVANAASLDCNTAQYTSLALTAVHQLTAGDTLKTVSVCLKDAAGLVSSASFSDAITLDTTAPTGTVEVAGGALTTSVSPASVALTFAADVVAVSVFASPIDVACTQATSAPTATESVNLLPNSNNVVTLCLRDGAGNFSAPITARIFFENAAGDALVIAIEAGAATTRRLNVPVSLFRPSTDFDQMKVVEAQTLDCTIGSGYIAFADTFTFATPPLTSGLAPAEGTRTVTACVRKSSDPTQTKAATDTIFVDTFLPNGTVDINNGATVTSSATVTANVTNAFSVDNEVITVALSEISTLVGGDCTGSFEAFSAARSFTFTGGDDDKTLFACLRDGAGNTREVQKTITLDRAPPSPVNLTVPALTSNPAITVGLLFPTDAVQVALAEGFLDCANTTTYVATPGGGSPSLPLTLSAVDGARNVIACFKDAAGNTSQASAPVTLDRTGPSGTVVIDAGNAFSTDLNVSIAVQNAVDAVRMARVESATPVTCSAQSYVAFVSPLDFALAAVDGTKTVQVCLEDAAGNQSLALADSIVLDRTAPNGTVLVNSNAAATSSTNVTLLIGVAGNTDVVSFAAQEGTIVCNSGSLAFQPFTTLAPFLLSSGDESKTVQVCLKDAAGNTSTIAASDAITLDTAQPLGGAVAIVDGDGFLQAEPTANLNVTWTTANDVALVKAGEGAVDCSSPQGYAAVSGTSTTLTAFPLTGSDGTKLVIACLKDAAGNIATAQDTSLRDNTRPTVTNLACTTCTSEGASTFSQSSTVTLALSSDEAGSGLREARVAVDAGGEVVAVLTNGTLSVSGLGAGSRVLHVKTTDNAGNTSTTPRDIAITVDGTAPALTQLLINESNAAGNATPSRTVNVRIVGASGDTAAMAVAEVNGNGPAIGSCASATYTPFVPGFTRTLPAVDGTKAVSVCLQDRAGNKSALPTTTTIRLDTTVPSLVATAVVIQDGGDNFLTSVAGGVGVQLNWTTVGDVVAFKLGENSVDCSSEPYVRPGTITTVNTFTQPAVALSTLDGTKVIAACFKDAAGNVTSAQDTTTLDQVGPNGSILAAGGAAFFTNVSEDVVVTARMSTDVARFSIAETTATNPTCAAPSVSCAAASYQVFAGSVVDGVLVGQQSINLAGVPAAENLKCFEACFEDAAGNRSTTATVDAITFDKTAPAVGAANITLVGANKDGLSGTLTRTPFITIAVAGAPADTASYRVSEDGGFAGNTQAFVAFTSSATPFSLSPGDAPKTISVQLRDTAGNVGGATVKGITLDATGPQSASVSIEAGAVFTRDLDNDATFGTTGATEMQISVDGALDTEPFVLFTASTVVSFTGVDGTKTVAVAFRDDAGNTAAASDTIVLDRAAPVGGSVLVNNGLAVTNSTTVTLAVTPPSDAVDMSVNGAAFVPVTSTILAAISAGDCLPGPALCKTVTVAFRDAAGNAQATPATDTIELDTTPPSSTSLSLSSVLGGDAAGFTTGGTTNVTFSYANGAGQATSVKHGEGAVDCSGTAGYVALDLTSPDVAANVVLSSSEGTKSYSACFKDNAGNITSSSSSIIADRVPPSGVVSAAGGNTVVNTLGPVGLTIIAADDVNRMAVSANVLNCATATYVGFSSSTSVTFTGADGVKTAHVCLKDEAGNVTSSEITDDVVVDTTDPIATLTIAEGTSVNTLDITLEIDPTTADVVEMAARELVTLDCASSGTVYDPFSASSTFFLAAGSDGPRNLAVCLRDAIGNTTLLTQTITLDRLVPLGTLALTTTNGFVLTNAVTATVTLTTEGATFPAGFRVKSGEGVNCADAGGYVAISGTTTASPLGSVALAAGEGGHTVTTCLQDAAGNIGTATAGLNVDLTAPLNLSVRCSSCSSDAGGNLFSATTTPSIAVQAQDPNANGFVRDVGITVAAGAEVFVPFNDEVTATLTGGTESVSVRFRDAAGRLSAAFALSITLDNTPPSATLVVTGVAAAGASTTLTRNPNVRITLAGASTDITQLIVSEDVAFVGADFVPFTSAAQAFFLLSQGDGPKTVRAKVRDRAGNEVLLATPPNITLDTLAPTNATTLIAAGVERTTINNPSVSFNAVGATQLSIITPDGAAGTGFAAVTFPRTQSVVIEDQVGAADDGTKTVLGVFRDDAGNESAAAGDSILLDRVAPVAGTVLINGGALVTNSVSVLVGIGGATSGADFMQIAADGVADTEPFLNFTPDASATLSTCPGNICTVQVRLKDLAGNLSAAISDTITLDTVVPSGLLISLEAGAVTTRDTTPAVTLNFASGAGEASQFVLGEGINCATATFAAVPGVSPQTITNALTLSAGDGLKSVTACFRDPAGNIASVVDQINLDTTPPNGITIAVAGGAAKTNLLTNIPITVTVPPGLVDVALVAVADRTGLGALSCVAPQAPATYVAFTGAATLGTWLSTDNVVAKNVQACFQDSVGNQTAAAVVDTIVLDNTVPAGALVLTGTIRTGTSATLTRNPVITVDITGESADVVELRIANEATFTGVSFSSALPLATNARSFALAGGDGSKGVFVEIKDNAGNITLLTGSIVLDTTAPLAPAMTLKSGDLFSRLLAVPVSLSAIAQADDGALQVAVDINGDVDFADAGDTAFTTTFPTTVTLAAGDGLRTVFAKFRDLAGNETVVVNDRITIDTVAPCATAASFTLQGNAAAGFTSTFTRDASAAVNVVCTGAETATNMRVNCNGNTIPAGAAGVPFQPIFSCLLTGADGSKDIALELQDPAGNVRTTTTRAITLDTTLPLSPTLSLPGNTAEGVNFACGRVGSNGTSVDTNRLTVQARVNGGAFLSCGESATSPAPPFTGCHFNTSTGKVSTSLAQDIDNLVEIRATDKAGNIGEASSVLLAEVSSALLTTDLTVKAVCKDYFLLKDPDLWPAVVGGGADGDVLLLTEPRMVIVDFATLTMVPFNGPGGIADGPLFGGSSVVDASCAPDSNKLVMVEVNNTSTKSSLRVWNNPLENRLGPISEAETLRTGVAGSTGLGVSNLGPVDWDSATSTTDFDFAVPAVDVFALFGGRLDGLRLIRYSFATAGDAGTLVKDPTVTVTASLSSQTGTLAGDAPFIIPLSGINTTSVAWLEFRNDLATPAWQLRQDTNGTTTTLFTFSVTAFPFDLSPWGIAATPATFFQGGVSPDNGFLVSRATGVVQRGQSDSVTLTTITTGTVAPAHQPFAERGVDLVRWVDNASSNQFIPNNDFGSTARQIFRFPIDQDRPLMGTARSAAGQPVVLFHSSTPGVATGVVLGFADNSGCFNP